ncbi:hypothetical protein AB0O07_18045 [Streptomyces sp. NPDC093085]|uniref:hypothetical protein n=1 Tax=Streptomyces sp. NPDC093085 TaxID=3155068 RepID=UPI0034189BF9
MLPEADFNRAMHVFGLLYLVDHRRVPRELWSRLTEETGHDLWQDPVDHASDLVLDAEERGDPSVLDEATALLHSSPTGPYRDTTLGLALRHRAAVANRPGTAACSRFSCASTTVTRCAATPAAVKSPTRS